MPNAIARRLSSLPMRPMPMMASVLLYSSTPSKSFRPHFLERRLASACGIFRATQSKSEKACSAVETVLPPGALSTTIPRRVAVSTSTLSTPTPARPTTRNLLAAFSTSPVTFVSLRTINPVKSGIISISFSGLSFVCLETSSMPSRKSSSTPRGEMESATRTLGSAMKLLDR